MSHFTAPPPSVPPLCLSVSLSLSFSLCHVVFHRLGKPVVIDESRRSRYRGIPIAANRSTVFQHFPRNRRIPGWISRCSPSTSAQRKDRSVPGSINISRLFPLTQTAIVATVIFSLRILFRLSPRVVVPRSRFCRTIGNDKRRGPRKERKEEE